ncbi:MAG: TfoX/Sxy family protein [Planctomycetaceae bacterium]|nr:TfoX/Sxy family protein [Planctomycetaceae bacterium]
MPYSEALAERVRQALSGQRGVVEKRMFGGLAFLYRGNMLVGVWQAALIARLGEEQARTALLEPGTREFDVTGRPMKGWIFVDAEACDSDAQLRGWIELALEFASALPPK